MSEDHPPVGVLAFCDVRECPNDLNDPAPLLDVLESSLVAIGATVLQRVGQRFEPQGCSALVVLAESHASVHTYPEHRAYMVDVFTCGELDAGRAVREIVAALGGRPGILREHFRGWPDTPPWPSAYAPEKAPHSDGAFPDA